MRTTIVLIILLAAIAGGISGWYFSGYQQAKRTLITTLDRISETANAQDTPGLLQQVEAFLAPQGEVQLNVKFKVFAMGSSGSNGWNYVHDKAQFADFLSEKIGKINGYGMRLTLEELTLDEQDSTQFTATIHASGFATGASLMMGRSVGTRYVIRGDCTASGTISDAVQVVALNCPIGLTQQADLSNAKVKDALKELKGLKP